MSQLINSQATILSSNSAKSTNNCDKYDELEYIIKCCVTKLEKAIKMCSKSTNNLIS